MPESSIDFSPVGRRGMHVSLRTRMGWELEASGDLDQSLADYSGAERLLGNRVVTVNL